MEGSYMLNAIKQFLRKLFCPSKIPRTTSPEVNSRPKPTAFSSSRKREDLAAEHQLAIFMDKYLYANFPTKSLFSQIKRIHDKEEQLLGVDVEFTGTDGHVYCVDEKAQLYYLNQNLPTFAFELLFDRGPHETIGWLCNQSLRTDFYMLIWPFAEQDSCNGITWDKFTRLDCLLIQKRKLLNMFAQNGLTVEQMQKDARNIRANGQIGKIPIHGLTGIYYYASDPARYREAPINIVVSKTILLHLAQRRYIVTPEDITTE